MKSALLAGGAVAAVTAYGFGFWHYGSDSFHFTQEDWFSQDSYRGGADKAGHVASSSILTAVFASANRCLGFDYREAAKRGALTSWAVLFAMEVGDGFSDEHGFSYEDIICNTAGCIFGYFHETSPWFAHVFDIRWEYWPTAAPWDSATIDPTTSYGDSTYILAVNTGALLHKEKTLLDFVDLQVGYQVRDLDNEVLGPDRQIVYGVGLNLANVLRRFGWCRVAKIFDYYQAPFISLRFTTSLDR